MAAARREPPRSGIDTVITGALSHRGGCGPGSRAGPGWPAGPAGLPGTAFPAGTECTWPRVLQQCSPRVLQQCSPRVLQQRSLQRKHTHVTSTRFRSGCRGCAQGKRGQQTACALALTPTEPYPRHIAAARPADWVTGAAAEVTAKVTTCPCRHSAGRTEPARRRKGEAFPGEDRAVIRQLCPACVPVARLRVPGGLVSPCGRALMTVAPSHRAGQGRPPARLPGAQAVVSTYSRNGTVGARPDDGAAAVAVGSSRTRRMLAADLSLEESRVSWVQAARCRASHCLIAVKSPSARPACGSTRYSSAGPG